MRPCAPRTRISRPYINASPSAGGRSGPSLPWRTPLCVVFFTCSPAMKCTVNWEPIISTNGGGSSPSIGSPGGLNAWGIGCIWNQWQHPRREKFSRQPDSKDENSHVPDCCRTGPFIALQHLMIYQREEY